MRPSFVGLDCINSPSQIDEPILSLRAVTRLTRIRLAAERGECLGSIVKCHGASSRAGWVAKLGLTDI